MFVPKTNPIFIDNENYERLIGLMDGYDEFKNYNLDIPLYEYEVIFSLEVYDSDYGPFKHNTVAYYVGRMLLPQGDLDEFTPIRDFLKAYSNWYCREKGDSVDAAKKDTFIFHAIGADYVMHGGNPEMIKLHINPSIRSEASTHGFGVRIDLENFTDRSNIISASSAVDDNDEVVVCPQPDQIGIGLQFRPMGGRPLFL